MRLLRDLAQGKLGSLGWICNGFVIVVHWRFVRVPSQRSIAVEVFSSDELGSPQRRPGRRGNPACRAWSAQLKYGRASATVCH